MKGYLFIQSQDQFYDARTSAQYKLVVSLAQANENVSILLVQNAVLATRKGVSSNIYADFNQHNIQIYADELSLKQREISLEKLSDGIKPVKIDVVIDAMLNGDKVVWW